MLSLFNYIASLHKMNKYHIRLYIIRYLGTSDMKVGYPFILFLYFTCEILSFDYNVKYE